MKRKIAICFRGGVSNLNGKYDGLIPDHVEFPIERCIESIKRNLIECNPEYTFDYFIHCWSPNHRQVLCDNFDFKDSIFELNANYRDWILNTAKRARVAICLDSISPTFRFLMSLPIRIGVAITKTDKTRFYSSVSSCLSIANVSALVLKTKCSYERIILIRPDVFYINPVRISDFDGIITEKLSPPPEWLRSKTSVNGDLHIDLAFEYCQVLSEICKSNGFKNNFLTHSWLADLCLDLQIPFQFGAFETRTDLQVFRKLVKSELKNEITEKRDKSLIDRLKRFLLLPVSRSFW